MFKRTEQEIMKNWKGDLDAPVVSVCCTTYNHEPYIAEAIDEFLMQETDFPFEILIRDDCSTDKTAEIVKEYAAKYPTLIKPIFEKENTFSRGVKPMPQLYKIATGKYIALCEGDDYWTDPLKLQKQVDFLEENNEYSGIGHNAKVIKDSDASSDVFYRENIPDILKRKDFLGDCPFQTATFVFRSKIVKEYPPEIDFFSGDKTLMLLISRFGLVKYIDQSMSCYRQHTGGISSNVTRQKIEKDLNIISFIIKIDPNFPKYKYAAYLHKTIMFYPINFNLLFFIKHYFLFLLYSFSYFPRNWHYQFITSLQAVKYLILKSYIGKIIRRNNNKKTVVKKGK